MTTEAEDPFAQRPQLFPEGITSGGDVSDTVYLPYRVKELGPGQSIVDWTQDYELFQPALLYAVPPWPVDPFVAYGQSVNREIELTALCSPRPLFCGLPGNWNHLVVLLPKEEAQEIIGFLGTLAINDHTVDILYRVRSQSIYAVEATIQAEPVLAAVQAIAIETSAGCHFFRKGPGPLGHQVLFATYVHDRHLVFDDTVKFKSALSASKNPYTTD